MLSSASTKVLLVVIKDKEGKVLLPSEEHPRGGTVGFATWQPCQFGPAIMAHAGFIFLKDYWGRETTLAAGKRIMRFWFDEMEPKLDIAVGLIASDNVLANRFVQRLGWTKSGVLPGLHQYAGKPSDAVIWHIEKKTFEEKGGA